MNNIVKLSSRHSCLRDACLYQSLLIVSLTSAFVTGAFSTNAAEGTVVIPTAFANATGAGAQRPFVFDSIRLQYIYNASQLTSAMPNGGIITGMAFRQDELSQSAVSLDIPSVEIRMATATRTAQTASIVFAQNLAQDMAVVVPRGILHLEGANSDLIPRPFNVLIPFSQPFQYDPSKGGLAIDILTFKGSPFTPRFDGDGSGANVSLLDGGVDSETGQLSGGGAIVELQFQAVPEPTVMSLLLFAVTLYLLKKERLEHLARF